MNKKQLILFCILFLPFPLTAEYRTNVHSISRQEGLSNGAVNAIAQDAEGYVWFGTWNGLNRYDGSHIATFLPGNKTFSIHNHVVRELFPTADGPIWMLTNKGLSLYDNALNRFYPFFTDESDQINYENDISIAHSETLGTLAAVFGNGIFSYDNNDKQFQKITFKPGSLQASLEVKRLHSIGDEFYCLTSSNLLFRVSGDHLTEIVQLPVMTALSSSRGIMINNRPYLFITQRGGNALMVDIEARSCTQLKLSDDIISSFAPSSAPERIWTGTETGKIFSLNTRTGEFEILNILSDLFVKSPIATRVLSICETAPDILWIGTDGNGVYNLRLSEFPNKSLSSELLTYPIVRCILVTSKKDLLIGTKGGGIDVFDAEGHHIKEISVKDGLSNNSVLSFHEHFDGTIWVGTDGKGIDIISPDYRHIKNFPEDFISNKGVYFASVYHILEDSDHRLFLGTSGFGVIMIEFDKNEHKKPVFYEQVILDRDISAGGQQKQIVYALTQGHPGIIWIGTRGFGIYRYNTITKRVLEQFNTSTHPDLITNDDILSLYSDSAKNIWAGSSSGIFSLSPIQKGPVHIQRLNLNEDLSNTSIHTIQMDGLGNLWATTNQGLSSIDPKNHTVKNFTANDGLINYEYSDGASFYDAKSGQLYVGGTMGIDIIQTREIKTSSFTPPIAINDLYIKNQAVEISDNSALHQRINLQGKLALKYNQDALTFHVSPLAFWGKERHRISYRLKNFDDNWVINSPGQAINFTNLSPGTYYLQLRVSDENGNWSPEGREIEIIINPPFWSTPWAIVIYILLFIGIQLLIIRSYMRKAARKKEAALLEFKQKKEEELQNYKLEFFTNVAHEFRTPLTLITSHIHTLLEDARYSPENPRLLKVYKNSIKLQKLVLEIMQFRKLEKGKELLNISEFNPELLAMEVISDLDLMAQKYEIACEIHCDDKNLVVNTDADKYQRILTNLISNAIKYNKPGGWVSVRITSSENEFITEVEDNGIGISPELQNKVFEPFGISSAQNKGSFPGYRSTGLGLAVTKGIVELLKGTISFSSKPDAGTLFTCRLPYLPPHHHHNPAINQLHMPSEHDFMDDLGIEKAPDVTEAVMEKPTILLVDDDPEILSLLNEMLSPLYNLCFAKNGLEALHLLEKQTIDLIISDIMMPEMDGVELCYKIRDHFDTSHLPLILLTARVEIEDRIKGLQAGADSYIPKPFHPDHLKVRIEKLLTLRQNIRKRFGSHNENVSLIKDIPDPFFQKLLAFIDENIDDENLLAEKLCERFAISKSSLYNKTKSVLGATPHGLINQRRVRKASVLLDTTSLTVSEIIDQTGFNSRAHFYELFNKAFGCSPSDYRQKNKSFS